VSSEGGMENMPLQIVSSEPDVDADHGPARASGAGFLEG
jgi:hypothetical protein